MKKTLSLLALTAIMLNASAQKIEWKADKSHSTVAFGVTHMVISTVTGSFNEFDIQMTSEGSDFSKATLTASAGATSISTNNTDRDNHLRSPDFFDASKFVSLTFKSTKFEKINDGEYKVHGDLTMRGITKPVVFEALIVGAIKDPWGNYRVGFKVTGKIDRYEWGLVWNQNLEAGSLLVSREVDILINTQMVTTTPPPAN